MESKPPETNTTSCSEKVSQFIPVRASSLFKHLVYSVESYEWRLLITLQQTRDSLFLKQRIYTVEIEAF